MSDFSAAASSSSAAPEEDWNGDAVAILRQANSEVEHISKLGKWVSAHLASHAYSSIDINP